MWKSLNRDFLFEKRSKILVNQMILKFDRSYNKYSNPIPSMYGIFTPFPIGNSFTNGGFSMVMIDYRRVSFISNEQCSKPWIKLPNYMGVMIVQYKDPYKPISIMEFHKGFESCSNGLVQPPPSNSSFQGGSRWFVETVPWLWRNSSCWWFLRGENVGTFCNVRKPLENEKNQKR